MSGLAGTKGVRGPLGTRMTIAAECADVPRGDILGWGTLALRVVETPNRSTAIRKEAETPVHGFDGSRDACLRLLDILGLEPSRATTRATRRSTDGTTTRSSARP